MRSVKEGDFAGKRVIIRCDLDVPLNDDGSIKDDTRLRLSVATIKHLVLKDAKQIIIIGHVDRPKGEVVDRLRTVNIAARLGELLEQKVTYVNKCIDVILPDDRIVVLENLRFHKEEKKNDEGFAKRLASLGDVYVNDAFAVSHRKHASVHAITAFLPSYAGFNLIHEVETMRSLLENPEKPFIAIIGGSKLRSKVPVITHLLTEVDRILLGGAMIFAFFQSLGLEAGKFEVDEDAAKMAKRILEESKDKIVLPEDVIVTDDIKSPRQVMTVEYNSIPGDTFGVDIGPKTIAEFRRILQEAKTVVWNGPMGIFEKEEFAKGTEEVAKVLAELDAKVIVGGGDSEAAIRKLGLNSKFTHISSGGGASLALLGGQELPALQALERDR